LHSREAQHRFVMIRKDEQFGPANFNEVEKDPRKKMF